VEWSLTADDWAFTIRLVEDVDATLREFFAVLEHEAVPFSIGFPVGILPGLPGLAVTRRKLVHVAELGINWFVGKCRTQSAYVVAESRELDLAIV
jgi:hypothetical protein